MTNIIKLARCFSGSCVTSVALVCVSEETHVAAFPRHLSDHRERLGRIPRGVWGVRCCPPILDTPAAQQGIQHHTSSYLISRGKTAPPKQQDANSDLYSFCARRSNSTLFNVGSSSTQKNLTRDQRWSFSFSLPGLQ